MTQKTRTRSSSTIPFGWRQHPVNSSLLVEHVVETDVVDYIRERRASFSLRELATVVKARTGKNITPRGIQKILDRKY